MSVWSSDVFSSNLKCLKTFYFTAKERVVAKKVPCCGTFLGAHELSVRGRWKRLRFYVHTRVFRGAQYNECPFLNRLGRICLFFVAMPEIGRASCRERVCQYV